MGLKIGICGAGSFGPHFVPVFQRHPDVDDVYLADLVPDRLAKQAARLGVEKTFPSLDALLASDCDAVALYTQRWQHAPQAIQALKAGKHVYCAVPAAVTLEELGQLVETVKETGLIYMMGETSYYRVQTHYCRERFARGDFGAFVYGEGQYYHDMAHFYGSYSRTGGPDWKQVASFPPMLYPTHSTAFVLGVTFRRMTEVSCLGWNDRHADGIFDAKLSRWGNVFSNECALMRCSDGGMARINEFRRVGAGEPDTDRMKIMGTHATYEEQPLGAVVTHLDFPPGYEKNVPFEDAEKLVKLQTDDVSHLHHFDGVELTEANLGRFPKGMLGKKFHGVSASQPWQQLPAEFAGVPTGHGGTHLFLVNDFVRSLVTGKLAPNHVWQAARYNAPGIIAHESAKRGGELMKIPDFGVPPSHWGLMDVTYPLQT
jgi:predicted dehydrogenase